MGTQLTDDIRAAIKQQLTSPPRPGTTTRKFIGKPAERRRRNPWAGGFRSDALGVNPEQIPQARAALRAAGVYVDYDENGCAILESERQYKDVAKASGMWSGRDGFHVPDEDGNALPTGRGVEEKKMECKRNLLDNI